MENVKKYQILLEIFENLPKYKYEPTYLDICHYSGRHFEEICSRILAFYFQPKEAHELDTLLIKSLFEIIDKDKDIDFRDITVNLEENAEGSRLDILLLNKQWVIGIENKIWAYIYNPLELYKKRIESFRKKNNYKIVLSLREEHSEEEKNNIQQNKFEIVYYQTFLDKIKYNINLKFSDSNNKYIIYLYDFIQTLESMKGDSIMNKELDEYFDNNSKEIDELIEHYQIYKRNKEQKRIEKLHQIKEKIINFTNNDKWRTAYSTYLYISKNNRDVGVEAEVIEKDNDPKPYFNIYLTTWTLKAWNQYEEQLKKLYPNAKHDEVEGRHFINILCSKDDNEVINKLAECYKHIIDLK